MKTVMLLVTWLRRLPPRFTVIFLLLMAVYLYAVTHLARAAQLAALAEFVLRLLRVPHTARDIPFVRIGLEGVLVVLLLAIGALLAYNLSAFIYGWIRARPRVAIVAAAEPRRGTGGRLALFRRIGIILAGGGAKGAYQAGAMKAIHEFLEQHDALDRVRMIAGTSIGSWNAMFWLAGLIKPPEPDAPSPHEAWWRSISLGRLVAFDTYWPLRRNHFLSPLPWREAFRQIFVTSPQVRERLGRLFVEDPAVRFYFTRSNVEAGQLEFATNWPGIRDLTRPNLGSADPRATELVVKADRCEVILGGDLDTALARAERAVFASMDLPPLFPYTGITVDYEEWFEDGGVVENLPVRFGTEIEGCDLLFILPLNASFTEPVNHTSVSRRLFRVMDVRQGVMERTSLKMVYLYNELAALRAKVQSQHAPLTGPEPQLEQTALRRTHTPVAVFTICPRAPLAIGTTEFWKPEAARRAFEIMYAHTRYELTENFERNTDPSWIRMTLVGPEGEHTYIEDF